MTAKEMYDFSIGQVAWYEKQNAFVSGQIAYCNNQLKRTRKEDKELASYAMSHDPSPFAVKVFGGKYVGDETKKLVNERARWYREQKHNTSRIAYYTQQAETWEKLIR